MTGGTETRHAAGRGRGIAALAAAGLVPLALLGAAPVPAAAQAAPGSGLAIPLVGVLGAPRAAEPGGDGGTIALPGAAADASGGAIALPGAAAPDLAGGAIALFGPRRDGATASPATAPAAGAAEAAGPAAAGAAAAAMAEPAETRPLATLWPLDTSRVAGGRAQLRGERDALVFSIFLPPGAAPDELTIAAVSSAFILPERSRLRVFVGDERLGEMPLTSITGPEPMRFALRPGQLAPGLNLVRVEADLVHRLYCGAQSSYDLWTAVDLRRSGAAMAPGAAAPGAAAFLAAASAARGAGRPVVVQDAAGEDGKHAMLQVSRQLGAVLGGGLTFARQAAPTRPGELPQPVVSIRAGAPAIAFSAGADGRQILEIAPGEGALPDLFGTAGAAGARGAVPLLEQDRPVPLAALGFATTRVAQHLWTEDVAFRLPDAWLVSVKERAVLGLGFAYLPGMPAGAELRVRVNGEVVRIIPLDRGGRLDDTPLEVRFDAALLRAGRNVLGFEASVPGDPADQPCLAADVGRIEIRETSTLTVPSSPRMHLPGIARWMAGDGPIAIEAPETAGADETRELFLGLAAALPGGGGDAGPGDGDAGDGGGPGDAARTRPAAAPGSPARRLVVMRPTDLSRAAFGEFAMGRQVMIAALQPPRAAAAAQEAGLGAEDAAFAFAVRRTGLIDGAIGEARLIAGDLGTRLYRLVARDPVAELTDWLAGVRAQAILFQLDAASPDDLHLLMAGDAELGTVLTALGSATERGVPLAGHLAVLTWEGRWLSWTDETRLPVLEEPLGEGNWRGALGNFASARPRAFVALLIALALVSVMLANSYIAASRRQL